MPLNEGDTLVFTWWDPKNKIEREFQVEIERVNADGSYETRFISDVDGIGVGQAELTVNRLPRKSDG
ncbi:MAG: hypothetical protein ABEN55_20400 [Bradymonadaceae bacterium]